MDMALAYAREFREANIKGLCDWLRIPSISTLPDYASEVRHAAEFAVRRLENMGMSRVEVLQTGGHPVVYAEWLKAGDAPVLLVYGHFDVQPIDPLEEWQRPPFEPVVDGDNLYARGASDDKGQLFAILTALEAYLKSNQALPVNLKLLLEGEEEITSPNLPLLLRQEASRLAADAILIADQDMLDPQTPVVMWGVRGNLYTEIEVSGPALDLHSGTFGGAVDNPINVLVRLLACLQDGLTRRVLIPDFYTPVQELTDEERELISQAPINDEVGLHFTGAPALGGEQGYPLAQRISVRPTLEIHGIVGGFTGHGSKTVIPSRATAKVSMRLVPFQEPAVISTALEQYLRQHCPPTVKLDYRVLGSARPVRIDYHTPAVQAAAQAYRLGFGANPVFLCGGGSLPIVSAMIETLSQPGRGEIPVVMIGFGLPDDHTHAPNEKLSLPNFYRGIETVIHYLDLFRNIRKYT